MEVDWFEWFRNITSVSGILFILRYIAIGANKRQFRRRRN